MKPISIYIHFPFCAKKCLYCDFPSYEGMEEYMDLYLNALFTEISAGSYQFRGYRVESIYLGGGTPTLFNGRQLAGLMEMLTASFDISPDAEITIEANPGTLDSEKLMVIHDAGVNRLSIGLQAGEDRQLKMLGRIHTFRDFEQSIIQARKAGFYNINVDLIMGIPYLTLDGWLETLERVVDLDIPHLSAYSLKVEDGTAFYRMKQKGQLPLPDEDTIVKMMHRGIDFLAEKGLERYEISNFSYPGMMSRHNLCYWRNRQYIGFGSAAHSYFNRRRYANTEDVKRYIQLIETTAGAVEFSEDIDRDTEILETIMMGLRLAEGISKSDFHNRFQVGLEELYPHVLEGLSRLGLIEVGTQRVKPTTRGLDLQNRIVMEFMD